MRRAADGARRSPVQPGLPLGDLAPGEADRFEPVAVRVAGVGGGVLDELREAEFFLFFGAGLAAIGAFLLWGLDVSGGWFALGIVVLVVAALAFVVGLVLLGFFVVQMVLVFGWVLFTFPFVVLWSVSGWLFRQFSWKTPDVDEWRSSQ